MELLWNCEGLILPLLSTYFFSSSSFPIIYVLQKAGRTKIEAGRERTDAGCDSNVGRDNRAAAWEEEVKGQTGGLRKRVGGGEKRGRTGDLSNVTVK